MCGYQVEETCFYRGVAKRFQGIEMFGLDVHVKILPPTFLQGLGNGPLTGEFTHGSVAEEERGRLGGRLFFPVSVYFP
jgi:hypothetical protein